MVEVVRTRFLDSPVASNVRVANVTTMLTVHVELPAELLALAGDADLQPSRAAAQLIALELFRENRVSLGKAAELAGMALEEFMEFSARRGVPLPYTVSDWETDHEAARILAL